MLITFNDALNSIIFFASNTEQVLVATLHKAPTIRPPASHHENYPT